MSRTYIESKRQEIKYGSTTDRLWWPSALEGQRIYLSTAPQIAIYDADGTVLQAATNMSQLAVASEGYLDYDALTADYTVGATLTGGTSTATAKIKSVRTKKDKTGTMQLINIKGTFANDETITDNGNSTGSSKVNGATDAAYSAMWYYTWAGASSYDIADDYSFVITFSYSSVSYTEAPTYFDIVYSPYELIVSSSDIDERHPEWLGSRDEYWIDWLPIIKHGHAALAAKLRSLGKRGSLLVDRGQLYPVELAYIEAEFAKRSGNFAKDEKDWYMEQANNALQAAMPLRYRADDEDTTEINEGEYVTSSRLTR